MQQDKAVHTLPKIDNIIIDGFRYSLEHVPELNKRFYFLTHFHSDHYTGINPSWRGGQIICSPITANLLLNVIKLQHFDLIHARELHVKYSLDDDIDYTFLDANHCPGAVMILFFIKSTNTYHLHTGDMRYHEKMRRYPELQNIFIDQLYLDTTYAHPKHTFMPQEDAITKMIMMIQDFRLKHGPEQGIIYIGTYSLGKERILLQLCDQLQLKVFIEPEKYLIFQQIPQYQKYFEQHLFTTNPFESNIHIVSMNFAGWVGSYFQPKFEQIELNMKQLNEQKARYYTSYSSPQELSRQHSDYTTSSSTSSVGIFENPKRYYTHALVFVPTGWADSSNYNKSHAYQEKDHIAVQLIPYSEHSSYPELVEFVKFLKPREVVPTVYSDDKNRLYILHLFHSYVNHTANMKKFIAKLEPKRADRNTQISGNGLTIPPLQITPTSTTNKKRKSQHNLAMDDYLLSHCPSERSTTSALTALGESSHTIQTQSFEERSTMVECAAAPEVMLYDSSEDEEEEEREKERVEDQEWKSRNAIPTRDSLFNKNVIDLTGIDPAIVQLERKISNSSLIDPPLPSSNSFGSSSSPRGKLQKQLSFGSQYGFFAPTGMSKIFNLGIKNAEFNLRIEIPCNNLQEEEHPEYPEDHQHFQFSHLDPSEDIPADHEIYPFSRTPSGNSATQPVMILQNHRNYKIVASPVPSSAEKEGGGSDSSRPGTRTPTIPSGGRAHRSHRKSAAGKRSKANTPEPSTRNNRLSFPKDHHASFFANLTDLTKVSPSSDVGTEPVPPALHVRSNSAPPESLNSFISTAKASNPIHVAHSSNNLASQHPHPSLSEIGHTFHSDSAYHQLLQASATPVGNRITTASKRGKVLKQLKLNDMMAPIATSPSKSLPPSTHYTTDKMFLFSNSSSPSSTRSGTLGPITLTSPFKEGIEFSSSPEKPQSKSSSLRSLAKESLLADEEISNEEVMVQTPPASEPRAVSLATSRYSSLSTTRNGGRRSNFSQLTPIDVNAVLGLSTNKSNISTIPEHIADSGNNSISRSNSEEISQKLRLTTIDTDTNHFRSFEALSPPRKVNFGAMGHQSSFQLRDPIKLTTNTSDWSCSTCTYQHADEKRDYLQCFICGTPRESP